MKINRHVANQPLRVFSLTITVLWLGIAMCAGRLRAAQEPILPCSLLLEVRGICVEGQTTLASIYDLTTKRSEWIEEGWARDGFEVALIDSKNDSVFFMNLKNESISVLYLRKGSIVPLETTETTDEPPLVSVRPTPM